MQINQNNISEKAIVYKPYNGESNISYYLKSLLQKGFLAYEYNPFKNFRLTNKNKDSEFEKSEYEIGSILDLDTEQLLFDLNHPVDISIQPSYDGSVNLILNDGKNLPRLINSRFTVKENNTYSIEDRIGNNDTNLYDLGNNFSLDISLYKKSTSFPKVKYNKVINSGSLKVGNYNLYFTYEDADGNETDFIAESGIISVFKGNDRDPLSINGGIADELANKSIYITLLDLDSAYNYVKVYVSRNSSLQETEAFTEIYKINKHYIINNNLCNIIITGDETSTELTVNDINAQYFQADSVKTQELCQNRLFFGNILKKQVPYSDLLNLSLQVTPYYTKYDKKTLIGNVNADFYNDDSGIENNYEYYNTHNIYYNVGYWNKELYRIGIVYIMLDGSLTSVYNILGNNSLTTKGDCKGLIELVKDIDEYTINTEDYSILKVSKLYNAKGVIRINDSSESINSIYSIGVKIQQSTINKLKTLGVKGFFIVRQKRIPLLLALAYVLPMDNLSYLPVIHNNNKYYIEGFINNDREITNDYTERLKEIEPKLIEYNKSFAGICPEFEINLHYFNSLFTGSNFVIKQSEYQPLEINSVSERFYNLSELTFKVNSYNNAKICSVTDENPLVNISMYGFKSLVGEAEDVMKYSYIGKDSRGDQKATNFARGIYSPYLAIASNQLTFDRYINIYIPEYSDGKINEYIQTRCEDGTEYYAISDRYSFDDNTIKSNDISLNLFRGDCYICNFTHRLNRNFQDPSAPTNDIIVDPNCWKDNWDANKSDNIDKINLGDLNAVLMGSWITMKVKSSINLSIRSTDDSHINEKSIIGNSRSFYPLQQKTYLGSNKIADSYIVNKGFTKGTSKKEYYQLPDVPFIKNDFSNRIYYSELAVNDSFRNGLRIFNFTNFRDFSKEYGAVTKLVELQGNLLCVFEHGVILIPVNEKNLIQGSREVFINSNNVLPMTGLVLSNMYGSQWKESIIKTPYYIYGVDTIGKKIWRTNGQSFEIISDGKVNKFLVDNITLTEREFMPYLGIRNVKTHYNANKSDVMFTFYDDTFGFEEKAWNLCWNELLLQFTTFYSWIPSYSANINNQYFSFDRNSSKIISKLSYIDGISFELPYYENTKDGIRIKINGINNRYIPEKSNIKYYLIKDNSCLNKYFKTTSNELELINDGILISNKKAEIDKYFTTHKIGYLKILAEFITDNDLQDKQYSKKYLNYLRNNYGYYEFIVGITSEHIYNNNDSINNKSLALTTDFWKHGTAGIYDIKDPIKPTFWYGELHPFEFEFVVNGNGADSLVLKIFNNLIILSNKAEPESFHFDIVGEGYEFSKDKLNMYYRLEYTKELFLNMGSDIIFNRKYKELTPIKNVKSSIFPLYYYRKDTYNEVYDSYYRQNVNEKDTKQFFNMSGSEIYWDKDLNEFRIVTHIPNNPINKVGRLRGNSHYKEDRWDIQIPSITFKLKNEQPWVDKTPPIVLKTVPLDLTTWDITDSLMPNNETTKKLDLSPWTETKETKIRDKYIRIRVRYSGKDLAIITAIHTLYTLSYA